MPISYTASPLPTQESIDVIEPDLVQLEKWKEYETALAVALLGFALEKGPVLCEWELLGRNRLEVYVYAYCKATIPLSEERSTLTGADIPAVIHLDEDGSIKSVELPGAGTAYAKDIRRMFPPDSQQAIFDDLIDTKRLSDHLLWRLEHQDAPPLIVLEATPMP